MKLKSREKHDADVEALRASPQQRGSVAGVPSHMTSSPSPTNGKGLRHLNSILEINPNRVLAEPGVTMAQLATATLAVGYLPKVLPEFKEITVAGAVMGAGLESSSFRFGQFNDTCTRYELLLASGERITAARHENADLYHGLSGSYGSLASLSLAEIDLMPAQPLVELRKEQHLTLESFLSGIADPRGADYLDGMKLPDGSFIIMRGWLTSTGTPTCRFSRIRDPWFCQHVIKSPTTTDVIPIYDYLFRYDRGAFWMGQFATRGRALLRYFLEWRLESNDLPQRLHACFRKAPPHLSPALWHRLLLGRRMSSSELYRVLHSMPSEAFARTFLVQDYYIPLSKLGDFIAGVDSAAGIAPLWFCPVRAPDDDQPFSPHRSRSGETFVNVGVYGVPRDTGSVLATTEKLEALCARLGGRKMLYGVNRYDERSFWSIYPREVYDSLREKWKAAGVFRDLFHRVSSL